ncbi:hypothetical protein B0H16DRAFT_1877790 [Mycena metata]|uniref:DUF6534 domain-containing protein n=1 Tax=Mycena metata TaxID=1033252 RepID=A0AAD7KB86_9AGAR|nr:hypothetical protein B0H16DRAFT_1877790 [Mycena metata]
MTLLDNTLGAILLGGVVSTFFFGIISMQAYNYFRDFAKDGFVLKTSVMVIWFFELCHTMLAWHSIYTLAVTLAAACNPEILLTPPITMYITIVFSPLITSTVQIFFANRIRLFSGKWLVPVLSWIMAILGLVFSFAMVAILCIHNTVTVLQDQFRWLMSLSLILTTVTDVLIAGSMCYWLWNVRSSGFQKTRSIADTLITWSIEYTVLKSIPNILQLILFLTRNDLLWIIFYLMKASLFSNSMLASQVTISNDSTAFIDFNSVVPSRGSQGAGRNRNVVIQMTRVTETHDERQLNNNQVESGIKDSKAEVDE